MCKSPIFIELVCLGWDTNRYHLIRVLFEHFSSTTLLVLLSELLLGKIRRKQTEKRQGAYSSLDGQHTDFHRMDTAYICSNVRWNCRPIRF